MEIKFFKNAIKYNGKRIRVWYSKGELINYPKGTITIYAKDYGSQGSLPKELNPENDSDYQSDYVVQDRARIVPNSKYYQAVIKAMGGKK